MNGTTCLTKIVKRTGEVEDFKKEKIENAIFRAMRATGSPNRRLAGELSNTVVEEISKNNLDSLTVEMVQDLVEKTLFKNGDFHLTKVYLLYRKQREQVRNTKELFTNIEVMDDYLTMSDWRVKESANSAYSLQGLNLHISNLITSQYWLNRIYPDRI
jgi:ribonucleoside-triphosphate reductase